MWKHFEGRARTREESAAYLATLRWVDWKPVGITLHNTAAPTLKQWAEGGPAHDARIRNLESYYENELGWHAGPHWFISRNWINWFSNPLLPGVHSRCWNATRFGIEMVGDYNAEEFNAGDGALVRDNAVFWIATLNARFGFAAEDLTFHIECKRDNHDCPGRKVVKADVIALVKAEMARQRAPSLLPAPGVPPAPPPASVKRRFKVHATEFGGADDPQDSAYGGKVRGDRPEVSLPARVAIQQRHVRVFWKSKSVDTLVNDLGPFNVRDPYWAGSGVPRTVEQCAKRLRADDGVIPPDPAGIDMTPAVFDALGIPGKPGNRQADVEWEFI